MRQDVKRTKVNSGLKKVYKSAVKKARQAKKEVNGGRVHESFEIMRRELRRFLKYTKFKQDMVKYLRP